MTGNERHYISEPQSNGGCERERLVSYFKNTTQFTVTGGKGEERGKFKIRSRVDGTSRSSRREAQRDFEALESGKQRSRAFDLRAYVECGDSHREKEWSA